MQDPILKLHKKKLKLKEGCRTRYHPTFLSRQEEKQVLKVLSKYKKEVIQITTKHKKGQESIRYLPRLNDRWFVMNGVLENNQERLEVSSFKYVMKINRLAINWAPPSTLSKLKSSVPQFLEPKEELVSSDEGPGDEENQQEGSDRVLPDSEELDSEPRRSVSNLPDVQRNDSADDFSVAEVAENPREEMAQERFDHLELCDPRVLVAYIRELEMEKLTGSFDDVRNYAFLYQSADMHANDSESTFAHFSAATEQEIPVEIHESAHCESQEEQDNGTVWTNGIEEHGSENDGLNQMEQLTMTAAPQSYEDEEAAMTGRNAVQEENPGISVDEFITSAVSRTAIPSDDHVHDENQVESAEPSTSTAGNQQPAPEKSQDKLPVNLFSLLYEKGKNAWLTDDIIQTFLVLVTKNTRYAVVDSSLLGDCSHNRINDEKTRFRLRDNILALQKEHKGKTLVLAFSDTIHWRLVLINERIWCYDPMHAKIVFDIEMFNLLAEDLGNLKLEALPHTAPKQTSDDGWNCGVFVLLKVQELCHNIAWSYEDVRQFRKKFREQIEKNDNYYWVNMDFGKDELIPQAFNQRNVEHDVYEVPADQEESHCIAETPRQTECAGQENLSNQGTVEKRRRTEDNSKEGPPQKKVKNGVMQVSIEHMERKEDEEMEQRKARKNFMFQENERNILRCLRKLEVHELISTCIEMMDDNNWLESDSKIRKGVPFLLKTSLKHVERELQTLIGKRKEQEEEIEALSDVAKALDAKVKKFDRNHIHKNVHGAVHDINKSTRPDNAVCSEKEVNDGAMRFAEYDREQLINRILILEKDLAETRSL